MDSGHEEVRVKVEGDRLSNLKDDIIHKILSFVDIKQAVETSVLSPRWRYIWTQMPCLNFLSQNIRISPKVSEIVTHILSCRNNEIEVSSVKLNLRGFIKGFIFKRILDYAFSHNVQQLNIDCSDGTMNGYPLSPFSSQSLKHLSLDRYFYKHSSTTPSTWDLPALTTMNLHCVTLFGDESVGLFSNCANLKNLTLTKCYLVGLNGLKIYHDGLSSLTLEHGCNCVEVVTPQLENLTVKFWGRIHLISAPNLISLNYKDHGNDHDPHHDYFDDNDVDFDDDVYGLDRVPLQLSTEPSHLEKVDICIECPYKNKEYIHKIYSLIQQLHSVKFLTLNLELVKLLFFPVKLIAHQPFPFANLKSLKIYPFNVNPVKRTQPKATISDEVKKYLLDGSPTATFTMVSHEEISDVMNVSLARDLVEDLQEVLDYWKEKSETNTTHMYQNMATVHEQVEVGAQPDLKMRRHVLKRMIHTGSHWDNLYKQAKKGFEIASRTMPMLQKIEQVLTRLPASHRDKLQLQTKFSSLCVEAETLMDSSMHRMMILFSENPRLLLE